MIDKISSVDWLESYSKLGEAAQLFLFDAFHHIHQEFEYQLAGEIFGKKIQKIDPTDADRKVLADSSNIPDNLIDLLKFEDDVLTKHTQERLENTWIEAQNEAKVQKHVFSFKHELKGISLLGNFTNFALFFEVLLNRHLLYLKISNSITDETYNTMDRSPVMSKLNFVFKEEINAKKVKVGQVSRLYKFRNLSVHYTATNAKRLKITIEQIMAIWKETKRIVEEMHNIEQQIELSFSTLIEEQIFIVKERWL